MLHDADTLAILQKDRNEYAAAEAGYQEALTNIPPLGRGQPETYLLYVSIR